MSNVVPKVQIQTRMKKKVVPCDKLTQNLFSFKVEEFFDIIENHLQCGIVEGVKKGKRIITPYWLTQDAAIEEELNRKALTAFDREVLFVAISAFEQGYKVLSFQSALNSLTGNVKSHVFKEQYDAIRNAIAKLMSLQITVDLTNLFANYKKYERNFAGRSLKQLTSPILPCRFVETAINGRRTLAVELFAESPLMTVARAKKQLLTYDAAALAVDGQNNTPTVIVLKNYLLRRIKLIGRNLSNTILFDTIYKECGLADATKWQRQDARKVIIDTLHSFKAGGTIRDFELIKQGRGYHGVKITLP